MNYFFHQGGFLLEGLHVIPADAVPVSDIEHTALMQAQAEGAEIIPDEDGKPITVFPLRLSAEVIRLDEITARLAEIDILTMRPVRAILLGTGTDDDQQKLTELEAEAGPLRNELRQLKGETE